MGWTAEEFHDFANVTNTLLWQGVAAVRRARISIAESRRLCEETRELWAAWGDDRLFRLAPTERAGS